MLRSQKNLFYLEDDVHYLNNAYMSPNLRSVEVAGLAAIRKKNRPYEIKTDDFFTPVAHLKKTFSRLIGNDQPEHIAITPSASYGLANAAVNLKLEGKKKIIIPEGQFPSNYYIWERIAREHNLYIEIIEAPAEDARRGFLWNEKLISSIDHDTAVVACGHVHWADGTRFQLKEIREACDRHDAYLILDTSQSLGALPLDISEVKPDALVNVGYKWLFGPYTIGFAYYNERFDNGTPIEENWINRLNSEDFAALVNYQSAYKAGAQRYCVGENSNFIGVPMMQTALDQILAWGVQDIQDYAEQLIAPHLDAFKDLGCLIEEPAFRGHHLVGIRLPEGMNVQSLVDRLKASHVHVSVRGNAIRLSLSVYNTPEDMVTFLNVLKAEWKA